MRNVVELSRNASIAARQLKLASNGQITVASQGVGAGSKLSRRKYAAPVSDAVTVLDARQIRAVCSTGEIDRAGDVIEQTGISWAQYLLNPVVLLNHDISKPIARCTQIGLEGGNLVATFEFPPPGTSAIADEALGLIKANVLSAISVGFDPVEAVPLDRTNPRAGQHYKRIALLECSVVAVPCNAHALIVQRAKRYSGSRRSSPIPPVLDALQRKADAAASVSSAHAAAATRALSVGLTLAVSGMSYQAPAMSRRAAQEQAQRIYEALVRENE